MNTEKLNAYKQVVEAMKVVNNSRTFNNLGKPERATLDEAALVLEEISWEIISDDISKVLDALKLKLIDLKSLNKKIQDTYKELKSISDAIAKAAEVVSVLIEITTKAIAAGLI
jgi:hypothetical protein